MDEYINKLEKAISDKNDNKNQIKKIYVSNYFKNLSNLENEPHFSSCIKENNKCEAAIFPENGWHYQNNDVETRDMVKKIYVSNNKMIDNLNNTNFMERCNWIAEELNKKFKCIYFKCEYVDKSREEFDDFGILYGVKK